MSPHASAGDKGDAKTKSSFRIFCNLFIAFVGAGILGLPFAFKEAGLVQGCVIMLTVGFISSKAMILLINCKEKILSSPELYQSTRPRRGSTSSSPSPVHSPKASPVKNQKSFASPLKQLVDKNPKGFASPLKQLVTLRGGETPEGDGHQLLLPSDEEDSGDSADCSLQSRTLDAVIVPETVTLPTTIMYGDVGYFALGTLGKMLVEIALVISQAGFCCSYLIYISETLSSLAPFSRIQILLLAMPLLMGMALIKDLHSMAVFSFFAQFANLSAFAVVFWFDFEHYGKVKVEPKSASLSSIPFFMAVGIYCYEGAGMILSIEDSVAPSHRLRFRRLFVITMFLVTLLYVSFGVAGFLSYGLETSPIITTNLPHGTGSSVDFAIVVKLLLCLALLFTYPVMLFPVVKLVEANVEERLLLLLRGAGVIVNVQSCMVSRSLIRLSVVLLTNLVVVIIPNFANLMALVGASCCTLLAFILPGIFHFQLFRNSGIARSQIWFDVFLIILGIVGASLGTADALNRIRNPLPTPTSPPPPPSKASVEAISDAAVAGASAVVASASVTAPTAPDTTVKTTSSFASNIAVSDDTPTLLSSSSTMSSSSSFSLLELLANSVTTSIPKIIDHMFDTKLTDS